MDTSLKRMYGFFKCTCGHRWQSSHVYCEKFTKRASYNQECKRCNDEVKPYRVEYLKCSVCKETVCTCTYEDRMGRVRAKRYIDETKRHLSHLCLKCKNGLPCNNNDDDNDDDDDDDADDDEHDDDNSGQEYYDDGGHEDECDDDDDDNDDDDGYCNDNDGFESIYEDDKSDDENQEAGWDHSYVNDDDKDDDDGYCNDNDGLDTIYENDKSDDEYQEADLDHGYENDNHIHDDYCDGGSNYDQ